MLSICIPIYNFNVEKLVNDLHNQASAVNINFEIICIDDCSDTNFKNQNKPITGLNHVKYVELNENIGRSKIRNLFLQYASYDHLLFLDCDVEIISESFIKEYIESIDSDSKLICGGLLYSSEKPPKEFRLRWKYGHAKEIVSMENRLRNPYKSFKTVNFIIKKDVFGAIKFDERITGYGHEDTWFGYQLKKAGIQIKHIDNPVLHIQLETNEQFIIKTEQSIESLIQIQRMTNDLEFEKEITLLKIYRKLKSLKIIFFISLLFWISKSAIRNLLVSGFANTCLFAAYKLGFLTQCINKKQ